MRIPACLIIVSLLFSIYYLLFTIPSVSAQTTNPNLVSNINQNVPSNLHTWTQNVMIEVMAAATCQLAGVDPINPNQKCLGVDPKTNSIGFVEGGGGAIGLMGNLIALTYTPPLHTGDYFSYLAQNFGIAKPAYAAGTGFEGLSPLMNLWIAFRNIVYLAFVVVFVIVGVAIMLRVKIDPRTVMTIENQIPKIIVGLLLVTFSFAIAGFLIDLMWVSIYLIIGIITSTGTTLTPAFQNFQGLNPLEVANNLSVQGPDLGPAGKAQGILGITLNAAGGVKDLLESLLIDTPGGRIIGFAIGSALGLGAGAAIGVNQMINAAGAGLGTAACAATGVGVAILPICAGVGGFIANAVQAILAGAAGATLSNQILGIVTGVIAFLIIAIALLWALLRLWFELIKAYIFILLDVVLAPFFIIIGLFPGSPIGFGAWLRDILANLSAFPVTIGMFLLGKVFIDNFATTQTNQFVPPLIGNPSSPNAIGSLIGLGIILMTPQVVNMMKEVLKAPKLDTTAIARAMGTGVGAPGRVIGGGLSTMFSPHYVTPPAGGPPTLVYPGGWPGRILRGFGLIR